MANPPNFNDLKRKQRLSVNSILSYNAIVNRGSPAGNAVAITLPPSSDTLEIIFKVTAGNYVQGYFYNDTNYALAEYWDGTTALLQGGTLYKQVQPGDAFPQKVTLRSCNNAGVLQGSFYNFQSNFGGVDSFNAIKKSGLMSLDLGYSEIYSDAGIQGRGNYESLYLTGNGMSAFNCAGFDKALVLDVSYNWLSGINTQSVLNLKALYINSNPIQPYNVTLGNSVSELVAFFCNWKDVNINSPLQNLTFLDVTNNALTGINFNALINLKEFYVGGNTFILPALDVSPLTALQTFSANYTPKLSALTGVSNLKKLANFQCQYSNLTSLTFSQANSSLGTVYAGGNQFKTLNVRPLSASLRLLNVENSLLRDMDLSNMPRLWNVSLGASSSLSGVSVQGCNDLTVLNLGYCALSAIDLTGLNNLISISLYGNQFKTLDMHSLSAVTYANISFNAALTACSFMGLSSLNYLNTSNCAKLSAIDLGISPVKTVYINNCQLNGTAINAVFNRLSAVNSGSIDISNNPGTATCNRTIATAKGWTVNPA